MTISRRQFVSSIAGAGIAGMTAPHLVFAQNSGPIRIGMLAVKTGPLASGGIDMELGMTMFLKERDNTLAGRKVELIVADTTGAPATARAKAQELIEKNDVHCIIGPLAAFEALAIADYLKEKEMPTLGVAAAEDMTQRHPSPWFVRLTSTAAQCAYPLAEYSAKELKY
jgi:branched-chain amino acid transport system substrate-binding protein